MKPISTTLCMLVCVAVVAPASAQITINGYPAPLGSGLYVQYDSQNEDGSNTVAISALIAASGANQVWDMTGITYETSFTGTYTVTDGATGPGAETSPLDQATITFVVPFEGEDDETVFDGVTYQYIRETDNAAYNMGVYFEGKVNGEAATFTTANTPDGDREFVFPLTMGSMWTSEFTQEGIFDADVEKSYEVDGWGTALLPGLEDPVDVLRVKETTTLSVFGTSSTTVCYDLWANDAIGATFCEGRDGIVEEPPTATATVIGQSATDAASAPDANALHFEAVYPNPVWGRATLNYVLPEPGPVTLTVYDVLGRAVQMVVDGVQPAGEHDARAELGGLAPGLYIARLQAGGAQRTRSFTVVR